MSLAALTWAFNQDLVPAQKVVLLALADYADDTGVCWPGQETLTRKTSLSVRGIRNQIRQLEEAQLVLTIERRKEGGARATNAYQLIMSQPADGAGSEAQPARHAEDNRHAVAGIAEPSVEPSDTPPTPSDASPIRLFEQLWNLWPNKKGRKPAETKFRHLSVRQMEEVLPKLGAHARAFRANTPPQYIPMLSTFLNQERWDDPLAVDRTRGAYSPEPRPQRPIADGPFDSTGALNIPAGMKAQYDDDGRFERFVPLGE